MNAAVADAYRDRFRRVLEYIDAHLEGELDLERLSSIAAYSKYHFHRQFSALYGLAVYRYVQLVRLKRASYQLAFRTEQRIIDIALGSGYESHEAFSRAFKKAFAQTPSEFRERPEWQPWHAIQEPLSHLRSRHVTKQRSAEDVRVVNFPRTRVAVLRHLGDPALLGNSVRKFIQWRKQSKHSPAVSATFNVFWDNPEDTPADQFRMDICAGTDREIIENDFGVFESSIPAGRCAVLRHVGGEESMVENIKFLYATWLPASGEEPRDYPLFLQRIRLFPDVPEHESVTDIFLPLK
ncbi:MAG: AraC family transcriptional regulator [Myxococcota bacterium]